MDPNKNESTEDLENWLNEGLEESVKKAAQAPPRTVFPTVPSGIGVPPKPAAPAPKPKTLQSLGIGRGGVVRNASTVARTHLNNPVANPKQPTAVSSILDQADLTPEFGVPTLLSGMDANLEERAKEKAQQILPAAPVEREPAPTEKMATYNSTLRDLLDIARTNHGILRISVQQFSLEIELHQPF